MRRLSSPTFTSALFLALLGTLAVPPGILAAQTPERTIEVILLTKSHQFMRDLASELQLRASDSNMRVEIEYAEFDAAKQAQMVDRAIERKFDAVILTPADSDLIGVPIEKLNQAGIPVFTVDIANLSRRGKVVSHIASDNYQGGRNAAALMVEALKGRGKVVIINHPKVTSVTERVAGFRDYLKDKPDIEIVADIPSWGQRDRAMSIMEDFMLMMPGINGVFAINDDSAMGALKAIESAGKGKDIAIVSYDGSPEVRAAIDKGKIFASIIQYPRDIARQALKAVSDYFAGKTLQSTMLVRTGAYRPGKEESTR